MAVYNGEHYLNESIDSILSQTFQEFEFLIIDDGSTDRSCDIINSYQDSRIRLVTNNRNIGLPCSLNKGLELARGEFIARQDADDLSEPDRLEKQVKFMLANPDLALLGTWYKKIDENGQEISRKKLPCQCNQLRWSLLFYCPFIHASVMLRRSALEEIGFYDPSFTYAQDYDLWSRIAQRMSVANLNEHLVAYRINSLSMTATYGSDVDNQLLEIRLKNFKNLTRCLNDKVSISNQEFIDIANFMTGQQNEINGFNVRSTVNSILKLAELFGTAHKFSWFSYVSFRLKVKKHISKQLAQLSIFRSNNAKDEKDGWSLLPFSIFLYPFTFFSSNFLVALLKSIKRQLLA